MGARGFMLKYYRQRFVGVTHILAAPFWSAIIPLQLHPGFRKNYRRIHRLLGTAFFSLSSSLMIGLVAIMKKKLQLAPGIPWAKGAEGRQLRPLPFILACLSPAADPFLLISGAWFSYTMVRAWSAAFKRRFGEHEEWVVRHIASGQWISLMRIVQGTIMMPTILPKFGDTQLIQSNLFGLSGLIAWAACVAAAEVAVARIRANRVAIKTHDEPIVDTTAMGG